MKQGRLEPVQTYLKNNKRGLGAEKLKKALKPPDSTALIKKNDQVSSFACVSIFQKPNSFLFDFLFSMMKIVRKI